MITRRSALLSAGAAALVSTNVKASEQSLFDIHMYTVHPEDPTQRMVFSPNILRLPEGGVVRFNPADSSHNCQSTPGMVPDGAKSWMSPFGKPFEVRFENPGYYGYHCLPHRGMGMVGLVIVEGDGMDANLDRAKAVKHPGQAAAVWTDIWARLAQP